MKKPLDQIAKDIAEAITPFLSEDYVMVFAILPREIENDAEYMLGSIPTLKGGSGEVLSVFEMLVEHSGKDVKKVEFERNPIKH